MDNDGKFWLTVWGLCCVAVCVLIVTVGVSVVRINEMAFENGYESATLQGCGGTAYWVKAK